ncbi:hypothetical protein [Dactylosporangium sp. CA-092794]|uniref:hypothetical protein n=1 Tax=Dactylosporangium sp. CA-092794 TaxID=3239929 RepID=UPI003D931801
MPEELVPFQEAPVAPETPPRPRPNVFALGCAAIAFGLAVAGQYLPWATFDVTGSELDRPSGEQTFEVPLTYLSAAHVAIYLVTLAFGLAALGVVLSATGTVRRVAGGLTAGLLAANLIVLAGVHAGAASLGTADVTFRIAELLPASKLGSGYLLAFAADLMLAVALVLAVRGPLGGLSLPRPRRRDQEPGSGEPLELTVTPVPPTFQ